MIAAILRDPADKTKVSLLYANQSEADILVRDMLEELQAKHSDRFVNLWWDAPASARPALPLSRHHARPFDRTLPLRCPFPATTRAPLT